MRPCTCCFLTSLHAEHSKVDSASALDPVPQYSIIHCLSARLESSKEFSWIEWRSGVECDGSKASYAALGVMGVAGKVNNLQHEQKSDEENYSRRYHDNTLSELRV
jgi:hypothetical protein